MTIKYDRILSSITVSSKTLQAWSSEFRQYLLTIDSQFDPGHRIDHVDRVVKNAIQLAQEEAASLEVVVPAIWLHDCEPTSKFSAERSKASQKSAEKALVYLAEQKYDEKYFEGIRHAIIAHSFSAQVTPETLEAKVVQDADRLDALGAIGIARVFMVGGKFDNAVYCPEEPFPESRKPEEKKYVIDHFFEKLLKIDSSFQTQSGRVEARNRKEIMENYLSNLGQEIGQTYQRALSPLRAAGITTKRGLSNTCS